MPDINPLPRPPQSLCWSCGRCTPLLCEWVNKANAVPEYVTKVLEKQSRGSNGKPETVTIITSCQRYEYGPLPHPAQMQEEPPALAQSATHHRW